LAKTASGINKPNGLYLILPDKAEAFVETLPIHKFYGIGDVTAQKMRDLGVHTGADLKQWSENDLLKKFGKVGSYYYHIVRGQDDRPVMPNRVRKSIGTEESYAHDLIERHSMIVALEEIAADLKRRVERSETSGRTLTLKVKYADYQQVTRSRTLTESIYSADEMVKIAIELMDTTEVAQKHARLLGLSLSNLDCEREEPEYVQLMIDFS
jgi:DNA polymerase-4